MTCPAWRKLPICLTVVPPAVVLAITGCATTGTEFGEQPPSGRKRLFAPREELGWAPRELGLDLFAFKSDRYIKAAAAIQAAGPEKAVAMLRKPIKGVTYGCDPHVLCRMLFKAKPGGEFRRPYLGAPWFIFTREEGWPLEPIALVDGVPFYVVTVYQGHGFGERPESYLEWCLQNCDWSDEKFTPKTTEEKQKALEKLLASVTPQAPPVDTKFLSDQIK